MNLFKKIKETWDKQDDIPSSPNNDDVVFVFLIWLVTPGILYLITFLLFKSHRVSFFLGIPIGFLLNFLFRKIVNFQYKIFTLFFLIGGILSIFLMIGYIFYGLFLLLKWIWVSLPN
jgi:hypothetical protein